MSANEARQLLQSELNANTRLPVTYDFTIGAGAAAQNYRVVVLPPSHVRTLTENLRKRADDLSISFLPTGRCDCCGR